MRILAAILLWSCAAWAQVSSGTLLGEVKDSSQALVPGAHVVARNAATGFVRTAVTNGAGSYTLDGLAAGNYSVRAEKAGFQVTIAREAVIEVNQKARLDFELKPGESNASVDVVADVSQLQTADSTAGTYFESSAVASLPLVGRNIVSLITVGPGAIPRQLSGFYHDTITDLQGNRGLVALNHPINGGRSTMNMYLLDGANNTDRNTFSIAVVPPLESVQEFRVQSSLAAAEFPNAGGGVIDVVTKSGGQQLHGSAYEYLRNEATDAHSFFDDPSLPRPIFRQNQFGGSVGGRVPLHSTFFFAAYDGLRGQAAASTLHLFPNTALRAGDFTGRNPIFDPLNADIVTGQRAPLPGNRIPASRIDGIARRYIDTYLPLPNRPEGNTNYLDSTPDRHDNDSANGRLDHQFRDGSSLFGRYTINDERGRLGRAFPERPSLENLRAQQVSLGYLRTGSHWTSEGRLSYTRLRVFNIPESAFQKDVMAELGITGFSSDPFFYGLPYFLVTNFETVIDTTTLPQVQRDNLWNASASYARVSGKHNWKAGFQWLNFQLNYLQSRFPRGQYQFNGAFTNDPLNPDATGDAFADFLLGYPQNTQRNAGDALAYLRQHNYGVFVQDDWRPTRRLTINVGLRYERFSPYTEQRGHLLNLDYSTLPAAPRLVGGSQAVEPNSRNFAPRLGLAWHLPGLRGGDSRTVLRAGYGLFYSPEIAIETYDLVRNGLRNETNQTNGLLPVLTTANGFPQNSALGLPSYFGLDRNAATPYMQQWNFSLQREIGAVGVLDVSYVGSKGTHLGRLRRFNTPLHVETGENLDPRPGDLQSLRTFPELGPIFQRQHIANSSYQSLQVKGERRLSKGLSFLLAFVWSKSIDDADAVTNGLYDSWSAQDERNLRLERGLSFFNAGRRLSGGVVYNVPKLPFLKPVFRGWQASGLLTFQDGTPLNPVYFTVDNANSGTPNRPDLVPGQSVQLPASQRSIDRYFNADAFQTPKPFTFGNAGRNILPSPGNGVVDAALQRRFQVRERLALSLRAEGFNILNHPNVGIPVPNPDFGPFFGRIVSAGEPRRFQFALRADF
ncbi:MAG: TonB-dependent receptor [Acidobacteria bacterium]|nr:TonB-dependent receptor [Acidobacteriota bacterium]